MKKLTKRLTMIVAILLSLVLLSSSIVSTTLAKYVVTKNVTANLQLQKFGLTVDLTVNEDLNPETKDIGDSAVVTIKNFKLKPGDDFKNAITAAIHGDPTVTASVTIEIDVQCTDSAFLAPKDNFTGISGFTEDRIYTPVGFYVGGSTVAIAPYNYYTYSTSKTNTLATEVEEALEAKISTAVGTKLTGKDTTTNSKVTGTIKPSGQENFDISITDIGIGFYWPSKVGSSKDEIGTWVAKNEPTFNITYKITVEQAS